MLEVDLCIYSTDNIVKKTFRNSLINSHLLLFNILRKVFFKKVYCEDCRMRRAIEKVDLESGVKVFESYLDLSLPSTSNHSSTKSVISSSSSKKRTHVPSSALHPTQLCSQLKRSRRIDNFSSLDFETSALSFSNIGTTSSTSITSATGIAHHFFATSSPTRTPPSSSTFGVDVDVGLSLEKLIMDNEDRRLLMSPAKCSSCRSNEKLRSSTMPKEINAEDSIIIKNLLKLQLASLTLTTEESDLEEEGEEDQQQELWI